MRVGFLQTEPRFGRPEDNLDRIETALAGCDADLVVLPELALSGYVFTSPDEAAALSEPIPEGAAIARLVELARRERLSLVIGLAERVASADGPRLYNSAVLITPGGVALHYRKVHLFDRETLVFHPGDLGFPVATLPGPDGVRVGLMVCFDWRFPEAARSLALAGADLIAHPSNLVKPWCQQAMITRCLENRVHAITANRFGTENRGGHALTFTGRSQIVDPDGTVLARAGEAEEALVIVDIDPLTARNKATNERNDLFRDRAVAQYRLE